MTPASVVRALAAATAATLREDAEALARFAAMDAYPDGDRMGIAREPLLRAAGLALAVATMQERGIFELNVDTNGPAFLHTMDAAETYPSLPAALAALLSDGPDGGGAP